MSMNLTGALNDFSWPELLNRVDDIVPFTSLTRDTATEMGATLIGDVELGMYSRLDVKLRWILSVFRFWSSADSVQSSAQDIFEARSRACNDSDHGDRT